MKLPATLLALYLSAAPALAGLHYSGESVRPLPARWAGYLPDHRALRAVANPKAASPLRDSYTAAAAKLEAAARSRTLSADEAADLGALHVRLGRPQKALDVLRPAVRQHPQHFRLAANLGTAWQLAGDLDQATAALEEAVRLTPPQWKTAEQYHLKLVRLRQKEGRAAKNAATPDDLFGAKPPADAVAVAQQLALWLPADGRLLWLLGELANASGDARTAANILDGCVTEFGMASTELREHRRRYRAAADAAEKKGHRRDRGSIAFESSRALLRGLDPSRLPAIKPDGVNALPWAALAETEFGPKHRPAFLKYVDELDGKRVSLTGYMTPAGNAASELTGFLLTEFPVGCWFCESPGPTQVLTVELADGVTTQYTRAALKVSGTLRLNRIDPERFPFTIADAQIRQAD
jgi:tetratricopeptide (TPR) repeat protein